MRGTRKKFFGEAEATTTLHDLGNTVDRDDPLDVLALVRAAASVVTTAASAAVAARTLSALGSAHDFSSVLVSRSEGQAALAGAIC
jgi:hypothetical protein